jgi:ankyrin repeat protein
MFRKFYVFVSIVTCSALHNQLHASQPPKTRVITKSPGQLTDIRDLQMMQAAQRGDVDGIQNGLNQGVPVDATNYTGQTALMFAVSGNRLEAVNYLIAAGADVNAQETDGQTVLMSAAKLGNVDIINALLAAGAQIDRQDTLNWWGTPLMYAAQYGSKNGILALINAGADLAVVNKRGRSFRSVLKEYHPNLLADADIQKAIAARENSEQEEKKNAIDVPGGLPVLYDVGQGEEEEKKSNASAPGGPSL